MQVLVPQVTLRPALQRPTLEAAGSMKKFKMGDAHDHRRGRGDERKVDVRDPNSPIQCYAVEVAKLPQVRGRDGRAAGDECGLLDLVFLMLDVANARM